MARAEGNGVSLSSSAHGSPLICLKKKGASSVSEYLLSGQERRGRCAAVTDRQTEAEEEIIYTNH